MPQTTTIKSLPVAFEMMKAMRAEGVEWGENYRAPARQALAQLLEGRMGQLIDEHLERMAELGQADRRNGYYARWLLTELGMIELQVPRTRTFSALKVVRAYARRAKDVDRMILACFLLGLSTRKVAIALLPILGRPVSPATVSAVARQLDAAVAAFHHRPLKDSYRVLVLDGVVLRRKTGAGALARPVLVALGLRPDGKKEVIDFRLASAERADAAQGSPCRPSLRRSLGEHLRQGGGVSTRRPRRPAHLLPLSDPRGAQGRAHHQCHRAPLPRSSAPHPPHGHLPGQNLHGTHPVRRVHARKSQPGPRHPFRPDTNLLTLPVAVRSPVQPP